MLRVVGLVGWILAGTERTDGAGGPGGAGGHCNSRKR
jgi:hypothetical protein